MTEFYDISTFLYDRMPVWKGDPKVTFNKKNVFLNNTNTLVTELCFSTHSATHIDFPGHFKNDHNLFSENIQLSWLIGLCVVIDKPFTIEKVYNSLNFIKNETVKRVIFKTEIIKSRDYIKYESIEDILSSELAELIIAENISVIGFDSPSPEKSTNEFFPVHQIFFEENILIIENLFLQEVEAGIYQLICLPLSLKGVNDGVPCRAILKRNE